MGIVHISTCHLGDARVNDQFGLTSIQTAMMREHNRVATYLSKLNPDWNDDRLYEEARRIVVAEIQHVTYNEFVPMLLGNRNPRTAFTNSKPTLQT